MICVAFVELDFAATCMAVFPPFPVMQVRSSSLLVTTFNWSIIKETDFTVPVFHHANVAVNAFADVINVVGPAYLFKLSDE